MLLEESLGLENSPAPVPAMEVVACLGNLILDELVHTIQFALINLVEVREDVHLLCELDHRCFEVRLNRFIGLE